MITISELENRTNELIEQFENDKQHNAFELSGITGSGKSTFLARLEEKYEAENKTVRRVSDVRPIRITVDNKKEFMEHISSMNVDLILIDEIIPYGLDRYDLFGELIDLAGNSKIIIANQTFEKLTLKPLGLANSEMKYIQNIQLPSYIRS